MNISTQRVNEIINFIKGLNLDQKYHKEFTNEKIINILYINESLTHSSANRDVNYENLEFLGDAVLRLIASDFIKNKYPDMKVGERSELRSHLVSDQWLEEVGKIINIKKNLLVKTQKIFSILINHSLIAQQIVSLIMKILNSLEMQFSG